jgi:hypothetical protein
MDAQKTLIVLICTAFCNVLAKIKTKHAFIIKRVASNKLSLLLKIDLQNTQTLQLN